MKLWVTWSFEIVPAYSFPAVSDSKQKIKLARILH